MTVLVNKLPGETRVALLQDGQAIAFYSSKETASGPPVGTILLGKVIRIAKELSAAFVDLGHDTLGFLPIKKAHVLTEGASIMVQVKVPAIQKEGKGPRLSQEIRLLSPLLILLPRESSVSFSKHFSDMEQKEALKSHFSGKCGLIFRRTAQGVSLTDLQKSYDNLETTWQSLEKIAANSKTPKVIYSPPPMPLRFFQYYSGPSFKRVLVDDSEIFNDLKRNNVSFVEIFKPERGDSSDLFEAFDVEKDWESLSHNTIEIPGGGSLIIEETSALTAIDVNSDGERDLVAFNKSAAKEIARQLRLRNVSGPILIDFAGQKTPAMIKKVMEILKGEIASDPISTHFFGRTPLGLVEIVRERRSF
ncbi:MAG: hypothetical protein HOI80_01380 [Alphaproteobacteria bacterium]|nr:hypothetical protein [Alphaproteobacteria bacterium]